MSGQVYPKDKETLPGLQLEKVDDRIRGKKILQPQKGFRQKA